MGADQRRDAGRLVPERLRQAREALGMSKAELGRRVSVSGQAVSKWEAGLSQPLGHTARKLAEVLGCSMEWLYGLTDDPQGKSVREEEWQEIVRLAVKHGVRPHVLRRLLQAYIESRQEE